MGSTSTMGVEERGEQRISGPRISGPRISGPRISGGDVRGGEAVAVTTTDLVQRHGSYLRSLARALMQDEASALDLEQDTWRVALEHAGPVREPRAWLRATARRLASTAWRSERRRRAREERVGSSLGSERWVGGESHALDAGDLLQAALRGLPDPFRETVVARYLEGLQPADIAARDGVSVETVKSRLRRGLARLRVDLDAQHGGRRGAWCAVLASGLSVDLPEGVVPAWKVDSTSTLPGRAVATAAGSTFAISGGLLTVAIAMKLTFIVSALFAASALAWFQRGDSSAVSPLQPKVASEAPASEEVADLVQLEVSAAAAGRDTLSNADEAATLLAAAPFSQELSVEVLDQHGQPAPGVAVGIAPAGQVFNTAGRTQADGTFTARWMSKTGTMKVDVALSSSGGLDLIGHQRLELRSSVTRHLRAWVHLDAASEFKIESVRLGGGEVVATQLRRIRRPVPECADLESATLAFRLLAHREPIEKLAKHAADLRRRIDVLRNVMDDVDQTQLAPGVLTGIVVDGTGKPVTGYPVSWRRIRQVSEDSSAKRSQRMTTVLSNGEGRYRIECAPGKIACVAGPVGSEVRFEAEIREGAEHAWSPVISRARDLMVELVDPWGRPAYGAFLDARRDDGVTRWFGRAEASKSGVAQLLHWPEASANLSFIAPEKIAPVPVLELTGVRAGEVFEYSIPEDKEVTFLWVTLAPADAVEGAPSLVGVRLRDSMDRYGAGLAVTGVRGEACRVRLPGGTWRIELEWEHGAVTDFGECVVTGDQPIDLGTAAPAPWSYLELPPELSELNLLQIYFETDTVDFVVYDSEDPSESFSKDLRLRLPTGTYVVRTQAAAGGDVKEQRIELRAGEEHSLQPAK